MPNPVPRRPAPPRLASRRRVYDLAACWPKVSLHLPLHDAPPELVRRTLDSLAALRYPALEILVVDTDTGQPGLWEAVAEHCARLGPQFRFFHLGAWPGLRAGALNFALRETAPGAALVGVLRSGQVVRPDWLRQAVPLFRAQGQEPGLGLAQARLVPPPGRCGPVHGAEPCLPLLRAAALRQIGGWDEAAPCPETALSLALLRRGWGSALLPQPMGHTVSEEAFAAWQARRQRQAAAGMAALRQAGALRDARLWRLLAPVAMDALALAAVVASLGCAALLLRGGQPPLALGAVLLLLSLLPLSRAASLGWPAGLGAVALSWRLGRAGWQGLLGGHAMPTSGTRLEAVLVALLLGAGLALLLGHAGGESEALPWAGLLLLQSLPGLAALAVVALPGAVPARMLGFQRHAA